MPAEKLTLSQLEQYLSKAAWILKGPIGASDFKAYIFPMLFFKRISDVYDEEYRQALEESKGDEEYAAAARVFRSRRAAYLRLRDRESSVFPERVGRNRLGQ